MSRIILPTDSPLTPHKLPPVLLHCNHSSRAAPFLTKALVLRIKLPATPQTLAPHFFLICPVLELFKRRQPLSIPTHFPTSLILAIILLLLHSNLSPHPPTYRYALSVALFCQMVYLLFHPLLPSTPVTRQTLLIRLIHPSLSQHYLPIQHGLSLLPFRLLLFFQLFSPPKHHRFRQPFIAHSYHMPDTLQVAFFILLINRLHLQLPPYIIIRVLFAHLSQRLTIPITPHTSIALIHSLLQHFTFRLYNVLT